MINIESEKLKRKLDDILKYEYRCLGLEYDFSKALNNLLQKFPEYIDLNIPYLLTNPRIYSTNEDYTLRFVCIPKEPSYKKDYIEIFIRYYLNIKEIIVKKPQKSKTKYNIFQNDKGIDVIPYSFSESLVDDKDIYEILDNKDTLVINYHKDKIIKAIIKKDKSNVIDEKQLFSNLISFNELNIENIMDLIKRFNCLDIKIVEVNFDEKHNYIFNYLLIEDGKIKRAEFKYNDKVCILDELGKWHYCGKEIKLIESDDLHETVTFNKQLEKELLSQNISSAQSELKDAKKVLSKIMH